MMSALADIDYDQLIFDLQEALRVAKNNHKRRRHIYRRLWAVTKQKLRRELGERGK